MKLLLAIGLGSFIGGISRYLLSGFINTKMASVFPWGTLVVNILGCFFIGILYGLYEIGSVNNEWRLFFATGILGGFTTFSAFSMESITLFRSGSYLNGVIYISLSIIVGLLATFMGLMISKSGSTL